MFAKTSTKIFGIVSIASAVGCTVDPTGDTEIVSAPEEIAAQYTGSGCLSGYICLHNLAVDAQTGGSDTSSYIYASTNFNVDPYSDSSDPNWQDSRIGYATLMKATCSTCSFSAVTTSSDTWTYTAPHAVGSFKSASYSKTGYCWKARTRICLSGGYCTTNYDYSSVECW